MVTDGKGRFRTSYLSDRTYVTAGVASISVLFELRHHILYIRRALFHARVCDDHFCAFDYDFFPHCRRVINPKLLRLKKKKNKYHIIRTLFTIYKHFGDFVKCMFMILSQIQCENNFLLTSKQWQAKVGRFLYISRARRSFLCLWLWFFPTLKKGHKKIKKRVSPCQLLKYKCHASQTLFLFNIVSIGFRPPCWWFMDLIRLDGFDVCGECA